MINSLFPCRIHFYWIISVLVLFAGCKEKQRYFTVDLAEIKNDPVKNEFTVDHLSKNVNYIPLEEDSASILTGVFKLEASDDYLFVVDKEQVYQFDKTGKFIRQIGGLGNGPQEFSCFDFDIDPGDKTIYILDYFRNKLVKFNFDGDFLGQYKNPVSQLAGVGAVPSVNYLKSMGDGNLLMATNSNTEAPETFLYNENTKELIQVQKSLTTTPAGAVLMNTNKLFYSFDGRLYGKHMFSDTVFHYTNQGKAEPTYLLSEGKMSIEIRDLNSMMMPPTPFIRINNIVESPDFLMVFYHYFKDKKASKKYLAYYDKTSKTLYPIQYFEEKINEPEHESKLDEQGTFKLKNAHIDGASQIFLCKDGNMYQVKMPLEMTETRRNELQLLDFQNPCMIQYKLRETSKPDK